MFTGQTGAKRRGLVHRRRTDVLQRPWLVARYSSKKHLADIWISFQGRQFGRRIWKIWLHLSICSLVQIGSVSFWCYAGKEIWSFAAGVAAVTRVWSWCDSRANAVGQCWCVSLLRCLISTARFSCFSTSDFWTWFSTQSSLNLECTADASCTVVPSNTVPKRLLMPSRRSALSKDWQIVRLRGAGWSIK